MLAVDVPSSVFDVLARGDLYLGDEDAWRGALTSSNSGLEGRMTEYVGTIRDVLIRRKAEGCAYIVLFNVREERIALVGLSG